MKEDGDDLAARLAALEGGGRTRSVASRRAPIAALVGVAALVTVGAVTWSSLQTPPDAALPTASPEEFQTTGSGFGDLTPIPAAETAMPTAVAAGPTESERALMESVASLRAELAALRAAAPNDGGDEASGAAPEPPDPAIAELTARIAALQTESEELRQGLQRQLTERDRELEQLRMELEVARLTPTATADDAPASLGISAEDQRLAELERRRIAEAEARAERIASPMLAFSSTGSGADQDDGADGLRLSPDEAFVRTGADPVAVTRAVVIVNPAHTVVQGTMIQAVTETALDSTLPGAIRAIVSEDVHSFDGTRVLIPRGARLIGRYRSDVALAQSRVMVAWDRIILPDNQTVDISAFGGDALGRTGTTGQVDTRFAQRFGSAALISLLGALPAAASGQIDDPATAEVVGDIGTDLGQTTATAMQDYVSIPPVIHVGQGTRITVMVDRDLEIF